jgi:ABC-type sulfate transport system permease component
MQPRFLLLVCAGAAVIALSILPISIKDELSNDAGQDMACMAAPWLLVVGFTIGTFELLYL